MTDALAAASSLFDLDPQSVRCPFPILDAMREASPVLWHDQIDAFAVTRYDLIVEVLRHPERFSSRRTTGPATDRAVGRLMKELVAEDDEVGAMLALTTKRGTAPVLVRADPPEHGRQRALVNRAFGPSAIRALEPEIEALAERFIDGFVDDGRVELATQYAVPIPMTVIAKALGVSLDRMEDFKRWSDDLVAGVGGELHKEQLADLVRARSELGTYLLEVIEERQRDPQDDLVTRLVEARIDGEQLTTYEIIEMVMQFLLAGNETTAKLITATVLRLAADPELADRLRADPELIPTLLEEVLRLEPPAFGLYRVATEDTELDGVAIPAGTSLWLVYGAGNRDPDQFAAPEVCQLDRPGSTPHLAFGLGPHFCIGAGLARAEARIAVRALLARCGDLALEVAPEDIAYEPSYMVRGIQRLPLTFTKMEV
jgi:cytochrome P450